MTAVTDFLEALTAACARLLPPPGEPVVIAVSGGADSCALLDGVLALERWPVVLCHLNHGLRANASADVQLLQRLVADYRRAHPQAAQPLDEEYHHSDIAAMAQRLGIGVEEAGRRARYALFAEVAHRYHASVVATAHHRDDQAETVMANILRGSGPVGMGGMPESRSIEDGIRVVRPLLALSHQQCCDYLQARGIHWHEDETNQDTRFFRNRIRHDILPLFEDGAPGFTDALLDFAGESRQQVEADVAVAARTFIAAREGDALVVDILTSVSERTRMLIWRRLAVELHLPMERQVLQRLENLLQGAPGRQYQVGGYNFLMRGRLVSWEPMLEARHLAPIPLRLPGTTAVEDGHIHARLVDDPVDVIAAPHEAFLCAQAIHGPLCWRTVREGERWHAFGSEGSRPLLRYLADRGVSNHARRQVGVVADDHGVVWIPGFTIADRVQVSARSDRVWHLRQEPAQEDPLE